MTENPVCVDPDLTLEEFAEDYILRNHHRAYPVTRKDQLLGLVHKDRLRGVPRPEWTGTKVQSIMTPLGELHTVSPDDPAGELLKLLRTAGGRLLVSSGDRLEGILSRRDLLDYIALRSDIGSDLSLRYE